VKAGDLARMGLFTAISAMLGAGTSRKRYDEHIGYRPDGGYAKGNTSEQKHGSPAGFKLVKKMYRRAPVLGWERKPKQRRKIRKYAARGYDFILPPELGGEKL
jgi:hypothetical protein